MQPDTAVEGETVVPPAVREAFERLACQGRAGIEQIQTEAGDAARALTVRAVSLPDGRMRLSATNPDGSRAAAGVAFPDGRVLIDSGRPALRISQGDRNGFQRWGLYLGAFLVSGLLGFLSSIAGAGALWLSLLIGCLVAGALYQIVTGRTIITKRIRVEPEYWADLGYYVWISALATFLTYQYI